MIPHQYFSLSHGVKLFFLEKSQIHNNVAAELNAWGAKYRVKQGGNSSPMLFNVYMDQLSIRLNCSGIGGDIEGYLNDHLYYADYLCSISLSSAGTQSVLEISNSYTTEQ